MRLTSVVFDRLVDGFLATFNLSEDSSDFASASPEVIGGLLDPIVQIVGDKKKYTAKFTPNANALQGSITVRANSFSGVANNWNTIPVTQTVVLGQTTTITFSSTGYDVGDVVSITVDTVRYEHTVVASATTSQAIYSALLQTPVSGISLANSLVNKGVTWSSRLTVNHEAVLTSFFGVANTFSITSNLINVLGVGTYRLTFPKPIGECDYLTRMYCIILGNSYEYRSYVNIGGHEQMVLLLSGMTTNLSAYGFTTKFDADLYFLDITIRSATEIISSELYGRLNQTTPGYNSSSYDTAVPTFSVTTSFVYAGPQQTVPVVTTINGPPPPPPESWWGDY